MSNVLATQRTYAALAWIVLTVLAPVGASIGNVDAHGTATAAAGSVGADAALGVHAPALPASVPAGAGDLASLAPLDVDADAAADAAHEESGVAATARGALEASAERGAAVAAAVKLHVLGFLAFLGLVDVSDSEASAEVVAAPASESSASGGEAGASAPLVSVAVSVRAADAVDASAVAVASPDGATGAAVANGRAAVVESTVTGAASAAGRGVNPTAPAASLL